MNNNMIHHAKGYVDSSQKKIRDILSYNDTSLPKHVRQFLLEAYDDLHRADVCLRASKEE